MKRAAMPQASHSEPHRESHCYGPAPRGGCSAADRCTDRVRTGPHGCVRERAIRRRAIRRRRISSLPPVRTEKGHEAVVPLIQSSRFPKPCRYPYRDSAVAADRPFPREVPRRGCSLRHFRAPRRGATGTHSLQRCRFAPCRVLRPRDSPLRWNGRSGWARNVCAPVARTSSHATHLTVRAAFRRPTPSHTNTIFDTEAQRARPSAGRTPRCGFAEGLERRDEHRPATRTGHL